MLRVEPQALHLLGALMLFMGLALLHALAVPPLKPIDERSHFSYALELRDGNLPEIETPVRGDIVALSRREPRNTVWVSNHPPLFYAAEALVIGEVDEREDVAEAFLRGRLLAIAFTALGLFFAYLSLRELCERDSKLPLLAVGLTASLPHFTHVMALIHNDTLSLLTTSAAAYAAIVILVRGYSSRRYLGIMLTASLCVATRASGMMVAAAVLTALAIACLRNGEGSLVRRLAHAAAAITSIVLVIALTSGWFYWRNYELYGDITGAKHLFVKFGRHRRGSFEEVLTRKRIWRSFYRQMWGYYTGNIKIRPTNRVAPFYLMLLALVGVVVDGVRRVWDWRAAGPGRRSFMAIVRDPKTLSIVMLVGLLTLTTASVFGFYSRGGNAHVRYFFPLMWFIAAFFGLGLLRLGPRLASATVTVMVVMHLLTIEAYATQAHRISGVKVKDLALVYAKGIEQRSLVVVLVIVAVGLALVIEGLSRTDRAARARDTPSS